MDRLALATIFIMAAGCVGELGGVPYIDEDDAGVVEVEDANEDGAAEVDAEGDGGVGDGSVVGDGDVVEVQETWVEVLAPSDGVEAPNPVTFRFAAGAGVVTVVFHCDDWPLQEAPIPVDRGEHTYDFSGVNRSRTVVMSGYDASGSLVASDEVSFVPFREACSLRDMPGFNHYTVAAINDTTRLPRDGSYPYCWGESWCGEIWGQIHDGSYGSEHIFPGGERRREPVWRERPVVQHRVFRRPRREGAPSLSVHRPRVHARWGVVMAPGGPTGVKDSYPPSSPNTSASTSHPKFDPSFSASDFAVISRKDDEVVAALRRGGVTKRAPRKRRRNPDRTSGSRD